MYKEKSPSGGFLKCRSFVALSQRLKQGKREIGLIENCRQRSALLVVYEDVNCTLVKTYSDYYLIHRDIYKDVVFYLSSTISRTICYFHL